MTNSGFFTVKINPALDVDTDTPDPLKREELFGALVVSVLEQLGYDPAGPKAVQMLTEILAASMLASKETVSMAAGGGLTLVALLCNEDQAMRATHLAHALAQLGNGRPS